MRPLFKSTAGHALASESNNERLFRICAENNFEELSQLLQMPKQKLNFNIVDQNQSTLLHQLALAINHNINSGNPVDLRIFNYLIQKQEIDKSAQDSHNLRFLDYIIANIKTSPEILTQILKPLLTHAYEPRDLIAAADILIEISKETARQKGELFSRITPNIAQILDTLSSFVTFFDENDISFLRKKTRNDDLVTTDQLKFMMSQIEVSERPTRNSVEDDRIRTNDDLFSKTLNILQTQQDRHPDTLIFNGEPLLHVAALNGNFKLAELLLKKGANANFASAIHGGTALHRAARLLDNKSEEIKKDKIAIANLLVNYGADINSRNLKKGGTALHRAAETNFKRMIQFLIERGADLYDYSYKNNENPYLTALRNGNDEAAMNFILYKSIEEDSQFKNELALFDITKKVHEVMKGYDKKNLSKLDELLSEISSENSSQPSALDDRLAYKDSINKEALKFICHHYIDTASLMNYCSMNRFNSAYKELEKLSPQQERSLNDSMIANAASPTPQADFSFSAKQAHSPRRQAEGTYSTPLQPRAAKGPRFT